LDREKRTAAFRSEQWPDGVFAVAPWPVMAISRYRASFNKEKVPRERAKHSDLTSRENGAEEEPREKCG
jgi:hypothetical protein